MCVLTTVIEAIPWLKVPGPNEFTVVIIDDELSYPSTNENEVIGHPGTLLTTLVS